MVSSRRTTVRRLLVGGLLALGLGAAPTAALAETSIERAARTGELSLGVQGDFPPYVSSAAGGVLEGYVIDVSGLIAEEVSGYLGKPVKVVAESINEQNRLFQRVHDGAIDLMCGAQFTWEREMFVDFSIPFALSGIRLLTSDTAIDGSPESLKGKRVGVLPNSLGEATIKALQPAARLVPQTNLEAGISALRGGRIDALAGDTVLLANAALSRGFTRTSLVPAVALNRYAVGCAMPENNSTLRNLANLAIARMLQGYVDGVPRYRQLVNRWLGPTSSIGLPEEAISIYFQSVLLNHEGIAVPPRP